MSIVFEPTLINGHELDKSVYSLCHLGGDGHHGRSLHQPTYQHDGKAR